LACFHAIADRMGVPLDRRLVAEMGYLATIGGSSLTDREIPVEVSPLARSEGAAPARGDDAAPVKGDDAAPEPFRDRTLHGAGRTSIPTSYVPFRNAHFLAIAVSWAETLAASAIYVGAVEEDSSGYPDCREEYYRAFERL